MCTLTFACFVVLCFGFFGGFSTFDTPLMLLRKRPPPHPPTTALPLAPPAPCPRRDRVPRDGRAAPLARRHTQGALRVDMVHLRLLQARRGMCQPRGEVAAGAPPGVA